MFAMVSLVALKNGNRDRNRDRRIWTAIEPKTERLSGVNCASVRPWPKSILFPAKECHPLRTSSPLFRGGSRPPIPPRKFSDKSAVSGLLSGAG